MMGSNFARRRSGLIDVQRLSRIAAIVLAFQSPFFLSTTLAQTAKPIDNKESEAAWKSASSARFQTIGSLTDFLHQYPQSKHAADASKRIAQLAPNVATFTGAWDAMASGDSASLRAILEMRPELVSHTNQNGNTLLLAAACVPCQSPAYNIHLMANAARGLYADVVDILIQRKSDVNRQPADLKITPLMAASNYYWQWGDINATVNGVPTKDAIAAVQLRIVQALLAAGADVNLKLESGHTALHLAAARGNVNVVTALLKHGANSALKINTGETAADVAAKNKQHEVLKLLSER